MTDLRESHRSGLNRRPRRENTDAETGNTTLPPVGEGEKSRETPRTGGEIAFSNGNETALCGSPVEASAGAAGFDAPDLEPPADEPHAGSASVGDEITNRVMDGATGTVDGGSPAGSPGGRGAAPVVSPASAAEDGTLPAAPRRVAQLAACDGGNLFALADDGSLWKYAYLWSEARQQWGWGWDAMAPLPSASAVQTGEGR
jgi:hypothetical protein